MASGMEWALKAVLDYLQIDGDKVKKQIAEFGQIVADSKSQLDRIEKTQELIVSRLGISMPVEIPHQLGDAHNVIPPGSSIASGKSNGAGN